MPNRIISVRAAKMYYHGAPPGGKAVIREGQCRKGLKNGTDYIGFIWFKPEDIRAAVDSGQVRSARLILTRSANCGQGALTVSVTQYMVADPSHVEPYTHKTVYDTTYRSGYVAVTRPGQTVIDLPCGLYRRFRTQGGAKNIIVLYHSPDETGNDYAAFTAAELQLSVGPDWEKPLWNRPVSEGQLVCDWDHSHRVDLLEICVYLSQRAQMYGLDGVSQELIDMIYEGYYSQWAMIIQGLWSKVREIQQTIDPDGPVPNVSPPTPGSLPSAAWVNLLRRYLETEPGGAGSRQTVEAAGRAYYTTLRGFMALDPSWPLDWRPGETALSGKVWGWIDQKTKKEYSHRFGIFMIPRQTGVVTSLGLELTTVKGQDRTNEDNKVRLYPVKVSTFPARGSDMVVRDVLDLEHVAGEATSAGVGRAAPGDFVETLTVPLNANFITGLQNGTYFGVAVECDQVIREYARTATLLVNGG